MRVVMQHGDEDCLLACYAMILSSFGREVDLNELSRGDFLPPGGASLSHLRSLNEEFGLNMRAARATSDQVRSLPRSERRQPMIAHWGGRHFVLLQKCNQKRVLIVDPAVGPMTLDWDAFGRQFSGVLVRFSRGSEFRRGDSTISMLAPLRGMTKIGVVAFGASLVAAQLAAIALSAAVKQVIDYRGQVWLYGLTLLVGLIILNLLAQVLRYHGMRRLSHDFERSYVAALFRALAQQPLEYFSRRGVGATLEKLSMRNLLRDSLILRIAPSMLSCLSVVGLAAYLAWIAWPLALVVVVVAVVFTVGQVKLATRQMRHTQAFTQAQIQFSSHAQGDLTNIIETKVRREESTLTQAWGASSDRLLRTYRGVMRATVVSSAIQNAYAVTSTMLVVVSGLLLNQMVGMPLATTLVFQSAMVVFLAATSDVQALILNMTVARAYMDSQQDLLHQRSSKGEMEIVSRDKGPLLQASGLDVLLPGGGLAVRGVNLTVSPGEVVVITGQSGAGKTSLLLAMLGQRDFAGSLQVADAQLTGEIGVVVPEMRLRGETLREALACPTDEAAIKALKTVDLLGEQKFMPTGLESPITSGGGNLSAGQRQRVLIARSLVIGKRLLVWDEPFSNLDDARRALICERVFSSMGKSRAAIVVSHHTDVLSWADKVLHVLPGGEYLVGRYEELLADPEFSRFVGASHGDV